MYRFSFDLGSGSLGWAVFELDSDKSPVALADLGVRIFPTGRDPKSKESKAMGRRQPRQQRRQIDRRKKRRIELEELLVATGLVPPASDKEARHAFFQIDPYEARGRAAHGATDLQDIGRAIWHMSKHRGFKSNRKTDRQDDDEKGKIASASSELQKMLNDSGEPTYGAWLASRHRNDDPVLVRPSSDEAQIAYDFYPTRAMLEHEFDHIWEIQEKHHPALTQAAHDHIRDTVFYQRPLKPVEPGRCTFFPDDARLPKWHPLAQEFLILQQLNMLKIIDDNGAERSLDLGERNQLAEHLMGGTKLTWATSRKGVRGILQLSADAEINLERGGLKELSYNAVIGRLAGKTQKKAGPLAEIWHKWSEEKKLQLLSILDESTTPEVACERLQNECELDASLAEQVEKISLPDGHLRLGERAVCAILQVFRENVIVYSEAVKQASDRGLFGDDAVIHHSDLRDEGDQGLTNLPRYNELPALRRMIGTGTENPDDPPDVRYGRITNPTVHVALGQFRRVMNALISRYGKPDQVVIETTRDMAKSARELNEIEREIKKNTSRNDKWRKELEEAGILKPGERVGDRFMRMRLWEELGTSNADRLCPYSGRPISLHQLHSDEVEIDHILPFADTFDDGTGNKTVCFRVANRVKGKCSPADAWPEDDLRVIIARVRSASGMQRKLWRFRPGAMEEWHEQKSFEDRQLNATSYLGRVVRAYTEVLFPKDGTSNIWMPPGRMTAMMRRRWGLHLPGHNAKTRDDHRHHALDAATVGMIDRRMVQKLQNYAHQIGAEELSRVMPNPPEPFEGFQQQVCARVNDIHASHRPDHSVSGRLHEDTAYGLIRDVPENETARREIGNAVVRKPVADLSNKEIKQVRDENIRCLLLAATGGKESDAQVREALKVWSRNTGCKRVRVIKPVATAKEIVDRNNHPYKWMKPAEIAYLDILEDVEGNWFHYTVDIWAAQSGESDSSEKEHPDARLLMRLFKDDTIQLFELDNNRNPIPGSNKIKRIVSLEPSVPRLRLAGVNEAGDYMKRHNDGNDQFRLDFAGIAKLRHRRARKVIIDDLGRVKTVPHGNI